MKHPQVRLDRDGMTLLSCNVLRRRLAAAGRVVFLSLLAPAVVAQAPLPDTDPSHHTSKMVSVDRDVQVEVLDWGGVGRPIILLAGMGNTAHIWDDFAPKLTSAHHVYAITRRGYGISSAPLAGYSADRLGDDVLAVMDALKIERPVLIGHSLGGEELSSIGSRHPERISALIYLEAGYSYAYYDSAHDDYNVDLAVLRRELDSLAGNPSDPKRMEPAEADLPVLQKDLEAAKAAQKLPPPFHVCPPSPGDLANFAAMRTYMAGRLGGSPPSPSCTKLTLRTRTARSAHLLDIPSSVLRYLPDTNVTPIFLLRFLRFMLLRTTTGLAKQGIKHRPPTRRSRRITCNRSMLLNGACRQPGWYAFPARTITSSSPISARS